MANDGEGPQTTTYRHDRSGRRTKVTHPGGAMRQYTYDPAGRMQTRTAEDGFITFYTHNWRGQVVQKRQTNAAGPILEEFNYDPLGRMTATAVGASASAQYKTTLLYGADVGGPNGSPPDGMVDGHDIQALVTCLLDPGTCPTSPDDEPPAIINPFFFSIRRSDCGLQ